MNEESTSDIYEDTGDSDSENTNSYYPFIKIENDGTVFIDGQPSAQDVSEMSIESAEVLVLPYEGLVEQLETLEQNNSQYSQTVGQEHAPDIKLEFFSDSSDDLSDKLEIDLNKIHDDDDQDEPEIKSENFNDNSNDIAETLEHDHNYQENNKEYVPEVKKRKPKRYSDLVKQLEQYGNACHTCEKTFTSAASLRRHSRIHTGERPFQCQICEKYFSQQSNLWKHVRTHTGERPFECPHCKKRFSQNANLKKHLVIHTGERPYVCHLCNKGFTQQANLTKHMCLHTGEKPHGCTYCGKRFTQRSNLQKHVHLHEGIKPYTCEVCFQAFTQQSNLRKHEMMHKNVKKFRCKFCNKPYVQKCSLVKHQQRCIADTEVQIIVEEEDMHEIISSDNAVELVKSQCLESYENGIIIQTSNNIIFTSK